MPRKTLKQPEPISDRTWNGSQSWFREVVEMFGTRKLRLTVRVNAYKMQSYGRAEVWNGTEWSEVHTIPGEQLLSDVSYTERNVDPARLALDLNELRRVARAVLS